MKAGKVNPLILRIIVHELFKRIDLNLFRSWCVTRHFPCESRGHIGYKVNWGCQISLSYYSLVGPLLMVIANSKQISFSFFTFLPAPEDTSYKDFLTFLFCRKITFYLRSNSIICIMNLFFTPQQFLNHLEKSFHNVVSILNGLYV